MKIPLLLGILLVSVHYSIQREEKPQTPAVIDDWEEQHGHLSQRETKELEEQSERSTKDEEEELTTEEEERPVQLPARDVEDRAAKEKKCSKKCAKNAQCVKGKCRCKKGFVWSRRRRHCVRRGRRCNKKCVKNARCVRGRCRCRRGFRWNKAKRHCTKRRRSRDAYSREASDLEEQSERSTEDEEKELTKEEEERPVQLPARDVEERAAKDKKCSKKCAKNAQCIKGKCRCKKGFVWSRRRRHCVRKGRRCNKKCVKNARCFRGKCRCRRGFRWNKAKRHCTSHGVHWFRVGKGTACEHKSVKLFCGRGRVIRVFYAVYGRRNNRTCAKGKPIKTTKCRAKNSKKLVVKRCDGRRQCNLKASNGVFGDPCRGTFKYLTVIYGCRKPCVRNAFFNGNVCKCKKGYSGNGFKRCSKKKKGRDVEQEDRRDVRDEEGLEINEDELERA